jgi:hypothetical protein
MNRALKRVGIAASLFFLVKGLVWLAIIACAAVWSGGNRCSGSEQPLAPAPEEPPPANQPAKRDAASDGFTRLLPMQLGLPLRSVFDRNDRLSDYAAMITVAISTCLLTGLLVIACRAGTYRPAAGHLRAARAGSIVSINRSTAGRTARAASLRPCV